MTIECEERKIKEISENIVNLIKEFKNWGYRRDLDFHLYRILMSLRKDTSKTLETLLKQEKNNEFIGLIYATLIYWNMAQQAARIKAFSEFEQEIIKNKNLLLTLSNIRLHEIPDDYLLSIINKLGDIYENLNLMNSNARLVSNAKTLHFLLPNLVIPMDNKYTKSYFSVKEDSKIYKGEKCKNPEPFLKIFKYSWEISKRIAKTVQEHELMDNEWNQTIPKIIDNAVIQYKRNEDRDIDKLEEKLKTAKFGMELGLINKILTCFKKKQNIKNSVR